MLAFDPSARRARLALTLLRVAVAILLGVHGVARAAAGGVEGFGQFLDAQGFPAGPGIAWIITLVEMVGGLALAAGWAVRPLTLWFGIQLLAGIYLVHGPAGWFVVGLGRNGVEYSVLLVVTLAAIALADPIAHGLGRDPHRARPGRF